MSLLWVAFHILDFSLCLCDISSSVVCGCCIFFVHRIIFFVQFWQMIVKQLAETIIAVVIIIVGEYIEVWSHILLYQLSSDTEIKTGNNKRCYLEDNQVVFLWTGGSSEVTSWISSKPWAEQGGGWSEQPRVLLQPAAPRAGLPIRPKPWAETDHPDECRMALFDPLDSQREINKKNPYESIRLKTRADICQTFNTDICTTDVQMDSSCSTNPHTSDRLRPELLSYSPGNITTTKAPLCVASICWVWTTELRRRIFISSLCDL